MNPENLKGKTMSDPSETARVWIRHLMEQLQQQTNRQRITEQLLFATNPNTSPQQWEGLIQIAMESPGIQAQEAEIKKIIESSMKRFDAMVEQHKLEGQLEKIKKELEDQEKKFIELAAKLPPPKWKN